LYGFCCCAYQNKQKINLFFFVCLGFDLHIQKIILQKRNETLFFKKRNETKRNDIFLEPKPKTETKYIFFRNKPERNEKKKTFFNPG
jgi:hypothetical protein